MEVNRVNMRDLLSQGLYLMMLEKPFDKITIKAICDKTGVIRGTFYNHFIDKYECLEYLTYMMIIGEKSEQLNRDEVLKNILHAIHEHKEFFSKCFKIQGQNSFVSILEHIFYELMVTKVPELKDDNQNVVVSRKLLSKYISNNIVFIIEEWIVHSPSRSYEEMIRIVQALSDFSVINIK